MAFKKGQSGNPGGRPKEDPELKELARAKTKEAIQVLASIMKSKKAPAAARVSAACALLDRGYGKPVQMTELSGPNGGPIETKDLTEKDLAREVAFLLTSAVRQDTIQ